MATMSPPISPQPSETRPRAESALSYSSHRSRRSNSSARKLELTESHAEKKRLNTKADPSKAMTEATPVQVAQQESTVEDIRAIAHKDVEGNMITDPDRSNPTRYRLERPLDTIRAFHAAAEGTSSRRTSSYGSRPVSQVGGYGDNRRASYYSQNGYSPSGQRTARTPGSGYYRNSSYGFGPQSTVEESPGASQMYARPQRQVSYPYGAPQSNGYHNGPQNGYTNTDSPATGHSYQQSYDAMTSGSEEYGKSTNPSSQNSSFDQLHQIRTKTQQQEFSQDNPYANEIQFNQPPPQEPFVPYAMNNGHYGGQGMGPPALPPKGFALPAVNNPRQPIKLGNSGGSPGEITPPASPKRQSWIKRKFSKRER